MASYLPNHPVGDWEMFLWVVRRVKESADEPNSKSFVPNCANLNHHINPAWSLCDAFVNALRGVGRCEEQGPRRIVRGRNAVQGVEDRLHVLVFGRNKVLQVLNHNECRETTGDG